MSKTPGLRRLVTIAWRLIYRGNDENRKRDPIIRSGLVYFFKYLDYKDTAEREEVVEGAGGTVDALTKLIMEYINFLIPFITTTNDEISSDSFHLHAILKFITNIDDRTGRGPVADALHENGIGTALAATILAMSTTKHQDMAIDVPLAFILLEKKLVQLNGPQVMRDAVVAGLLRGIVQSCILGIEPQATSDLLRVALPACTVYYSVISKLEPAIRDVEDLVTDPDFMRSPHFELWQRFRALAEMRIRRAKYWTSDEFVSRRACDNLEV
jgi:hypothetical protein